MIEEVKEMYCITAPEKNFTTSRNFKALSRECLCTEENIEESRYQER